jgi:predicted nucleic acid-binding protein
VIRAVIDTNVPVSDLLAPAGNEALIVLAIHHGLLRPCFSVEIPHEYAEVLARPKFAFPSQEVAAALAMFHDRGELIAPVGPAPV